MPIPILMPALSPTMTEGKLAKWLKKEGETIVSGDLIAEIETDKATMEVEATDEGTLGKILVQEGAEGVAVNTQIGLILEEGEDQSALDGAAADTLNPAPKAEAPKPQPKPEPQPTAQPEPAAAPSNAKASGRVFASPLARRLAKEAGIDLNSITGSGPHGRIVKADIAGAPPGGLPATQAPVPVPASVPSLAPSTVGSFTEIPNSTMRKVIGQRLSEAKRDVPHYYLAIDCMIDDLLNLRADLNSRSPEGAGAYKLSVNDFIVRAVALAMRQVPGVNASWDDEAIRRYNSVDVAIAVATPGGLITPIVRSADNKGLASISNEIKELAGRAKEGKLQPEEYQGGGFTISNLGMFGIKHFTAIINPPQSAILAIGAGEQRPVVIDGALAIATVMTCTLSADHRSIDGALGAQFLASYKKLIEEPLTMLL